MTEQSRSFNEWLERALGNGRIDAGEFARSAICELPKIKGPRPPSFNAWPKSVREEMRRIWKGEKE